MNINKTALKKLEDSLPQKTKKFLNRAANLIIEAKEKGKNVVAVVGSGPNLHEGVTTLIAELIHKGIINGVSTSSAVINHEMGGTLEKVKRIKGVPLGIGKDRLPLDGFFEVSLLSKKELEESKEELPFDLVLYQKMRRAKGKTIIKVAGNMAYPTGYRIENLSRDILAMAKKSGKPFELIAGYGADPMTMIGAGAQMGVPVLVTVPQLIGGGEVGISIGDSIPISERCFRIAKLLDSADIIIESALALSQEIHDGPFERLTGHGIWTDWQGGWTYSLANKKIIRIDLDPNLEKVWEQERKSKGITNAVHLGQPKTKKMKIPVRMEMSGFARLPGSLPIRGDIGAVWPLLADKVSTALGINLEFMSYKQSTPLGEGVREWIVKNVRPINKNQMITRMKDEASFY